MPFGAYTRHDGSMNLATYLPNATSSPELGPKCFFAYGPSSLTAASSSSSSSSTTTTTSSTQLSPPASTNLHVDLVDAVNVLVYVQGAAAPGAADTGAAAAAVVEFGQEVLPEHGAVWHIFSHSDTRLLHSLLPKLVRELGRQESRQELLDSTNVLLDGCLYLDAYLLAHLHAEAGIVPYTVLQRLGDALLVPAGCAYQMRNLRSCIHVGSHMLSPEHVSHGVRLTEELRQLPSSHPRRTDVLSLRAMLFHAACACLSTLEEHKRREEQSKRRQADEKHRRAVQAAAKLAATASSAAAGPSSAGATLEAGASAPEPTTDVGMPGLHASAEYAAVGEAADVTMGEAVPSPVLLVT